MFYPSPDEDIFLFRPLKPRLFSPSPEEKSSYPETQTFKPQEFSKPKPSSFQSPKTTPKPSRYISFPPFQQQKMFSCLREIICGTTTPSPIGTATDIRTIYPNSKGNYTYTNTSLSSPPPSISRLEENQPIMSSTCECLRGSTRPRLRISIPGKSNSNNISGSVDTERTFAVQNQQVDICSHTRRVRWADPLVVAVSADFPTRDVDAPTHAVTRPTQSRRLEWGNPLITEVSVEPPHPHLRPALGVSRLRWGSPLITKISAEPLHPHLCPTIIGSEGVVPSMVAARYCSHAETIGLVEAIAGLVGKGGERGDGGVGGPVEAYLRPIGLENDDISPLELDTRDFNTDTDVKISENVKPADVEHTLSTTNDTANNSIQNISISIIETGNNDMETTIDDMDRDTIEYKGKGKTKPTTINHNTTWTNTPWTNTPWTDEEFERYKQGEYGWIV